MSLFSHLTSLKCILSVATLTTATLSSHTIFAQASSSVPIAHAHNDYEHERPLHDALQAGFTSVEADVYLVDNQLLVAHDRRDTTPDRSLESLYLNPLRQHFSNQTDDSTHKTFWLMIDVKSDAIKTHRKIQSVLERYPDLFSCPCGDKWQPRQGRYPANSAPYFRDRRTSFRLELGTLVRGDAVD
jgi:hypothetical protein